MGAKKPTSPARVERRLRQARALELKAAGWSTPAIAKELSIDRATAWKYVRDGLAETVADIHGDAGTYRAIQHERIEAAIGAVMPQVLDGNLGAVDRLVKLLAREGALMGLDLRAPDQVEQHLHVHANPVAADADSDIIVRLREWAVRNRDTEQGQLPDVIDHQGVDGSEVDGYGEGE
jgi:post-segregation antitoxin (ccd killing protein)